MRRNEQVTVTLGIDVMRAVRGIAADESAITKKRPNNSGVIDRKLRADAEVSERIEKQDKQGVTA